jgi:subtilase family serine protease
MAGGTSAGSPIWAGIGALFGQYLANKGLSLSAMTMNTPGGFNGMLYGLSPVSGGIAGFYTIDSGSNNLTTTPCSVCTAGAGYNFVTGLGAPNVANLFSNF